ncbi:uncharacterized protein [Heptranchias perlo]|uniref:uncharacterized protein n=1 Tax=Heptranchias perlo TaxID=212740 RepID=UPI00355AA3C3
MTVSECNSFHLKASGFPERLGLQLIFLARPVTPLAECGICSLSMCSVIQTVPSKLNDNSFNITIIGFQNGSVVVNFLAFLSNDSNVTTATLQSAIGDAIKAVDKESSVTVTGSTTSAVISTTISSTSATPTTISSTSATPATISSTSTIPTNISSTSATPTTISPTSATPTTNSSTSATPTTISSTSATPTTISPTSETPTTISPTSATPTTNSSTSATPTTISSTSATPTTISPTSATPSTISPTSATPTTISPTSATPSTISPTSATPTTISPTSATPTTISPTSATPSTISPTSATPTTISPTSATPTTISSTSATPTTISSTKPLKFLRINLIKVESETISITWDTNNAFKQPRFNVTIFAESVAVNKTQTEQKAAEFRNLQPDVVFQILISTTTCGQQQTITRKVRTAAVASALRGLSNIQDGDLAAHARFQCELRRMPSWCFTSGSSMGGRRLLAFNGGVCRWPWRTTWNSSGPGRPGFRLHHLSMGCSSLAWLADRQQGHWRSISGWSRNAIVLRKDSRSDCPGTTATFPGRHLSSPGGQLEFCVALEALFHSGPQRHECSSLSFHCSSLSSNRSLQTFDDIGLCCNGSRDIGHLTLHRGGFHRCADEGDHPFHVGKDGLQALRKALYHVGAGLLHVPSHFAQAFWQAFQCPKHLVVFYSRSNIILLSKVATVVEVSTRITNVEFTSDFEDKNSQKYKDFVKNFTAELEKGLTADVRDLIRRGKMRIIVTSIEQGSLIVKFGVTTSTNVNVTVSDIKETLTESLNNTQQFAVDLQNTTISDRDSCQPGLNDCSGNGTCIRLNATYTCQCNAGFTDTSPNTPGRTCEDVDECQTGNNTCADFAACRNSPGNYSCGCFQGILDTNPANPGTQCRDVDECQTGNNTCSDFAACTNTPGNYSCGCFEGILDTNLANPGTQCRDPNTCFVNLTNICALSDCLTMTVSECNNKKAFRMKARLRSREFSNELKNPSSEAYRNLSAEITNAVVQTVQSKLNDNSFNITIIGFQNGSVVVNFLAFLSSNSNVATATLQSAIGDAIKAVDNQSSVTVTGTTQSEAVPTVQTQPENPGWRVAVIVLGAVLGLALLIILAVVLAMIYTKKSSRKYYLDGSDMLYKLQRSDI